MRGIDLHLYTKAAPFRPFRIVLINNKTYDVYHPEFLTVGMTYLIYHYRETADSPAERSEMVSTVMIEHVEHITVPVSAA